MRSVRIANVLKTLETELQLSADKRDAYAIHYEWTADGVQHMGVFPQQKWLAGEEHAWKIAETFAEQTRGDTENIYVVKQNYGPVGKRVIRQKTRYPLRYRSATSHE